MSVHIFTSITCNYLPKARVLARSVKTFCPDCSFHLVLVDRLPAWFNLAGEPFDSVVGVEDLGLDHPEQWLFQHSVVEACTGVKGFAMRKLLDRPGCSSVFYFDPDIVLLAPIDGLLHELETASVLLTPHLTVPERTRDAILDNEFSVLRHGIYNLGFVAVSNTAEGRRFAEWWADRLKDFCYDDIPRGLFTDQRWADLAPAYFDSVRILRSPQYNVCTWNLTHRTVNGSFARGFTVNGLPLVFYHFSGLDSGAQKSMLDKYGSHMPALQELRNWYLAECGRMGQQELGGTPWAFGSFDNGMPVTSAHRLYYRENIDLQTMFPCPYSTVNLDRSYYHWFERNGTGSFERQEATNPVPLLPEPKGESLIGVVTGGDPEYRVLLSICGADPETARSAALELTSRTHRRDALYLAGSEEELGLATADALVKEVFRRIALPAGADHEAAFRAIAALDETSDFIFVTSEVIVPKLWDLRLAWTAQRVSGAATVSPINDASRYTSLGANENPPADVSDTDVACYEASPRLTPEIPRLFESCFYVRGRARAEVRGGSIAEFGERATRLRWTHILADHIYTGARRPVKSLPPSYRPLVLDELRHRLNDTDRVSMRRHPVSQAVRKQLHIMHSWGGGLQRWVEDYCRFDCNHDNLVLKSQGAPGEPGTELCLFTHFDDPGPIARWPLNPAVKHTADRHDAYRAALSQIIHEHGIDVVIVSSVIGHSIDVLRTGLRTVMVCHDFYPFCPALNITFEAVCRRCEVERLEQCTNSNPHNRFFQNVPPPEWITLRTAFADAIQANRVRMIAPAPSVRDHYLELMPELNGHFHVVPHGTPPLDAAPLEMDRLTKRKLRVVVLGSLAPNKGGALLGEALSGVTRLADVFLVGCGEYGRQFGKSVTCIPEYRRDELPGLLRSIGPDAVLLLSVVPETFSYTLQEAFDLAIPVIATRIGSFADRISDGVNGFLIEPEAQALIDRLRTVSDDRGLLESVHQNLRAFAHRRIEEMLAAYEEVIESPHLSGRAYFAPRANSGSLRRPATVAMAWSIGDERFRVRTTIFQSHTPAKAVLRIPATAEPLSSLRVEFDPVAGPLTLHGVRLSNGAGRNVWSWTSRESALESLATEDLILIGGAGGSGILVYPSRNCSHWVLPAGPDLLAGLIEGGVLEIEIAYPSTQQLTARLVGAITTTGGVLSAEERKVLTESLAARSAVERDEEEILGGRNRVVLRQLLQSRKRVVELEQSLSWRVTAPLRWGGTLLLNARARLHR